MFGLCFVKINDKKCRILAFSVGNADCFLIKTPQNKYIMIDTGRGAIKEGGFSLSTTVIDKYFKNKAIKKLECLILTHYDSDHIGGTVDILESTKAETIILNRYNKETSTQNKTLDYIEKKKFHVSFAKNDNTVYSEPGLSLKTFVPDIKNSKNMSNDTSIIVLLTYADFDMLFMADGGISSYNRIKKYLPEDIEVIKTGHHGASGTIDTAMLKNNHFNTAIISTGKNRYGHPDRKTIDTLIDNGIEFYRTDVNNAIEITTDGFLYSTHSYNPAKRKFLKLSETYTSKL